MAIDTIASAGSSIAGTVASIFKSKKHYHLYYFEPADGTWHFVIDGHPSQINPVQQNLAAQGLSTYVARNKDGKYQPGELAPKNPPSAVTGANKSAVGTNWLLIVAVIAGFAVIFLFVKRARRKK